MNPYRDYKRFVLIWIIVTLIVVSCRFSAPPRTEEPGASPETDTSPTATAHFTTTPEVTPLPLPAPKVLSYNPARGETQPLDAPIELVFDQPMDRTSVARAFDIQPDIEGSLDWTDERTLVFEPRRSLARGTRYQVTIGQSARNAEGTGLVMPIAFDVQTVGYLAVSEVQPAPGSTEIDPDTTVTVIFNRPVVPLTSVGQQADAFNPLTFSPPVQGKGEWLNTAIYRFRPTDGFQPATEYTARVQAGLEDTLGGVLQDAYSWVFTTLRPAVVAWSPQSGAYHIGPSDVISITFNQPMDHDTTEAAFVLEVDGQPVTGAFRWQKPPAGSFPDQSRWLETMTFMPDAPLPRNATCRAGLERFARAKGSEITLETEFFWQFNTTRDPGVLFTFPLDGEVDVNPYSDVQIIFASPMQREGLLDYLTIIPEPTKVYSYWSDADTELRLAFSLEPATAYVVTLDGDIPDKYGAPLGNDLRLRFTTGDLPPYARLNTGGGLGTFNAYTQTLVYAAYRNVSRLDVRLYSLSVETFMRLQGYGSYDYREDFAPSPGALLRAWSVPLESPRNQPRLRRIDLTDENDAQLPPGIYYLTLTSPDVLAYDPDAKPSSYTFIRSRLNLALKQAHNESLVWATDLATGAPVAGVNIRFNEEELGWHGEGTTDAEGLVTARDIHVSDLWSSYFAVSGEPGDENFAIAFNDWDNGIRPWNFKLSGEFYEIDTVGYLYTDRPLYRPGQTVYFKGIVRSDDDAQYTVPADMRELQVTIVDPQGKELYNEPLTLNDLGTLSGEMRLDAAAPLGTYYIQMQDDTRNFYASVSFRLAEYRKPEFQVTVTPDHDQYLSGDRVNVSVSATYYFGGPVANARLSWNVLSDGHDFNYQCPRDGRCPYYSWRDTPEEYEDAEIYGSFGRLIDSGEATTDGQGRATFSVSANIAEALTSRRFTIEANVTDINNQVVSNRAAVIVHKGEFYIGLAPQGRVAQVGEEEAVDVLTVDWDSVPKSNVPLDVVFMEHRWYNVRQQAEDGRAYWTWTTEDIPVFTTTVTTDVDGKASVAFVPEKSGAYKVRATGQDDRGNEIRSSTYVWVWGGGAAYWRRESNNRIDLIVDRDEYRVGDVAEILIPSPYSGTVYALVTIERGHIIQTQVRQLRTDTELLKIPIEEGYAPNIFISVVLVQGIEQTQQALASFKMGAVMLPVSIEEKELNITLTPDRSQDEGAYYRPRETVTYDILVTDYEGQPVETELSLRMADLAVLALADERGPTLVERFWRQRGLGVRTTMPLALAMEAYNRELAPRAKGGGGGAEEDLVRTNFADTAFWDPIVRTDKDGRAQVEVTLPDNLTTWRMQARGITLDTQVGRAEVDVRSTLDVLVRPILPRFFVVGDRADIATIVHNNTQQALTADVNLDVEGLEVGGSMQQRVNIPAGNKVKLIWPVTVQSVSAVKVRMAAQTIGDTSYYDAREDTLPVYRYSAPEVVATAGRLTEAGLRQELIQLPSDFDPTQGELRVQVDGSLTAATQDTLDYLTHYPYECVEQTVSRFLPNVLTYQALTELGAARPELRAELEEQVVVAMQRLYNQQHYDGGWGWWLSDKSNPYLSAYVLQGLLEAYRAGFTVDEEVMHQAVAYLRENLLSITQESPSWQANRQAYQLYVLGEYIRIVDGAEEAGELGWAVGLFEYRHLLDRYGRATLAVALGLLEPEEPTRVDTLLSNLAGDAVLSATGTHWEEGQPDYWNMNTDVRTTAIVLWAMARHHPGSNMLPETVRWLMNVRRTDGPSGRLYWESTYTTSWVLMALTAYMRATGELQGDFSYTVSLNGEVLLADDVNADTIDESRELVVEIARLLVDEGNRLIIMREPAQGDQTGEGQLYYTAHLQYYLPVEQVEALDRGIIVVRQYTRVGDPSGERITEAEVGDVIQVKLTVIAPNDLHYVVVEDPLPAGCEAVDLSLNTTSVVGEQPELHNLTAEQEDFWYQRFGWGWWWFSHSELRDEKVSLFATYLPRGTYEYTYLLRASVPGTYHIIPATAYEMYFPEVFGRSDGDQFVVSGE